MTTSRDPDRLIHAFLQEGEERLHDQIYDAVRADIEQKRQRVFIGPWRTPIMSRNLTYGLAAAAVVVIGLLVGTQLLGSPTSNVGGPGVTPSPTAEPTSTPDAFVPEQFQFVNDQAPDAPRMMVTIPAAGWSTSPFFQKGGEVNNLPEAAILVYLESAGTAFYVYGDPCQWPSTTPETPATTVEEIVAAFAAQASRDASEPVDVTVDGYAGKVITLHVPDDANPGACEGGEFASFGTQSDDLARYHQGPGQIDELWILDVNGATVIIDTMYRPDSRADIVDEMRSIVESATFTLP